MSLITEQVEKLRELSKQDKLGLIPWNGYSEILNQAADTIEVYQKAFEDIRADIEQYEADCILATDNKECKECDKIVFGSIYHIIDKHNPDKAESEGNDMVSRRVFEQVMWERDLAIKQLKDLGYGFGEKPKTGHWILTDDDFVYCSECEDSYYPRPIDASWYYCPHCGCRMIEP